MRGFFVRAGVAKFGADLDSRGPVRVIAFESVNEYSRFQTHPAADAYFLSTESRDYLVLPTLGSQEFGVAAHEYAHLVLRSFGVSFPPWLAEGIAEFFSTVRIEDQQCFIGGDLPGRVFALRRHAWIPIQALLSAHSPAQADRTLTNLFYSESWALTDMLIFSPGYAPKLSELLSRMSSGSTDPECVAHVYGKPLNQIMADLQAWVQMPRRGVPLPGMTTNVETPQITTLADFDARAALADLLLACGKLNEAETEYRTLQSQRPDDANVHAALGTIALRNGNRELARQEWKRAMQLGVADATLCYRFAILAEDAGDTSDEVRNALIKAIDLKPDFDDARYKLGLLEYNSGQYDQAIAQLQAIRDVPRSRAYGYWLALASALTETDDRPGAKDAAKRALSYATTEEERSTAVRLSFVADTDLTVQLSRDANGNTQVVTARKPHGSDSRNPFVEPGDQIRRLDGQIRRVECNAGKIVGFKVEGNKGAVEVKLVDPAHVLITGGTPEFVCGAEDGRKVAIEYAASGKHDAVDGVLRGMRFQ